MPDENPTIDMTSEADQSFMDTEAEPQATDHAQKFKERVWRYREHGWDTSGLHAPDEFEGDGPEDVPPKEEESRSDTGQLEDIKQKMAPEGRQYIENLRERKSVEWVQKQEKHILTQARKMGHLKEER